MPVRNRRYEYRLQFIFGGLLMLVIVAEIVRRVALYCIAHMHCLGNH